MKNGLSLRQQKLQVIMYYIITCHEHFISSLPDKTNAPQKNEKYFYFSLTLKDTEIFPKLLFWNNSWVTATVFHNRFLIINLYLMTVDHSINLTDGVYSPSKPVKTEDRKFVRWVHIMLFPPKRNTTAKGQEWIGMRQQTWHKRMSEFVCYYCFYWELFTVSRWTYIEHYGKNYQAATDAFNKNLAQYRGEAGLSKHPLLMKCFHKIALGLME